MLVTLRGGKSALERFWLFRQPYLVATAAFAALSRPTGQLVYNQHTYFLHGIAQSDAGGPLDHDWLAQTVDSVPVFTLLVRAVVSTFPLSAFEILHRVLAAIYFGGLCALAHFLLSRGGACSPSILRRWQFAIGLYGLHLVSGLNYGGLLFGGVAGQYVLGPYVQPSSFGVLLIVAFAALVWRKTTVGIALAWMSVVVHPTYTLSAIWLAIGAGVLSAEAGSKWRAVGRGTIAVGVIGLTGVVLAWPFRASDPEVFEAAQVILYEQRIPHHARISDWFDGEAAVQVALVVAAIVAAGRRSALSIVLGIGLAGSMVLTLAQLFTGNLTLALAFPWRSSVWLVPVATTALWVVVLRSWPSERLERLLPAPVTKFVGALPITAVLVLVALGLTITHPAWHPFEPLGVRLARSVEPRDGQTLLIPPEWSDVRLGAPASVFVDWKSHPYRDAEVVAWYARYRLAKSFFESTGPRRCQFLSAIQEMDPRVQAVLLPGSKVMDCAGFVKGRCLGEGCAYTKKRVEDERSLPLVSTPGVPAPWGASSEPARH